jgi:hypothetical protein
MSHAWYYVHKAYAQASDIQLLGLSQWSLASILSPNSSWHKMYVIDNFFPVYLPDIGFV